MRKDWYYWPIAAGAVGGFIARDFCAGPIFGVVCGIVVGIPLYYIVVFVLKIITKRERILNHISAALISCAVVIIFQWFAYNPSASSQFKSRIADPIPDSVKNIKAESRYITTDYSKYLKFNINEDDLKKIITEKGYEPAKVILRPCSNGGITKSVSSLKSSSSFILPDSISWFTVDNFEKAQAYVMDKIDEKFTFEYIIYDSNTEEAIYEFATF